MNVTIATTIDEVKAIRPLADEWKALCGCDQFSLEVDVNDFLIGLAEMIRDVGSDLLLLKSDNDIVGIMGLVMFKSPFGNELIANEHYMFVKQGNSAIGSKRLIDAAEKWAKSKGCSHLMLNASNAASDMHDKVCKFYERLGLSKFETSFIKEIS